MKSRIFGFLLIAFVFAFASCSKDEEVNRQISEGKLVNKKWYRVGSNGKTWIIYNNDGTWKDDSGDYGTWALKNGNTLKITATLDLLQNWEEEIFELSDGYLKKQVKGVYLKTEFRTTP